ncbi:hypothetical protein NJB14197_36940 [Mycobacterium montefiorense]|nr:hypothetical protein NJB14191_07200 [Mycobacterium montefiorense]GKU41699.1 hypothetical protein NJB14192_36830 [Mycobacterium montefiorense]GKU52123.1 hypothetical protein NJB14195_33670 [Mycobacterium montefiorense]GKU57834.1 hypothetical protein NJB14197_36940 [Mycobacterium montefiorense]GKU63289.1 hypothetical protein NJB18182_37890 [Mycobacterium montefiorense]
MNALGGRFAGRGVGSDDQSFVAGSAQMLQHSNYRVTDTVDMWQERLCDDRNAHKTTMSELPVDKVADGHTGRKICC